MPRAATAAMRGAKTASAQKTTPVQAMCAWRHPRASDKFMNPAGGLGRSSPIVEYPRRRPQMLVPLRPDPACSFRRVGVAMEHDDLRTLRNGRTPDPVHDPARQAVALEAAAPGLARQSTR